MSSVQIHFPGKEGFKVRITIVPSPVDMDVRLHRIDIIDIDCDANATRTPVAGPSTSSALAYRRGGSRPPQMLCVGHGFRCDLDAKDYIVDLNSSPLLTDMDLKSHGKEGVTCIWAKECWPPFRDLKGLETLKNFNRRRVQILASSGADLIAFETIPNKLEAKKSTGNVDEDFVSYMVKWREVGASLFDGMLERNVVSWTSLICGYASRDCPDEVFGLPNEKKAAYGALDKWNAWETESPLIAAAKYLKEEESMEASNLSQSVEVLSNAPAQCPISKSQCEQLLALFNSGTDQGSNHHVASVSTSAAASSMISGAAGVTAATGVPSTSLSSSSNAHSGFVDTMSDPFLPSAVEASFSDDATNFVTPISISESSHLDITDPPSPSHHHFQVPLPSDPPLSSPTQLPHSDLEPSSSPPVASAPPLPNEFTIHGMWLKQNEHNVPCPESSNEACGSPK
nr:selenocysteine se-methyltransferase [Quercus suber]